MEEVLDKNAFKIYTNQVNFSFEPKTTPVIEEKKVPKKEAKLENVENEIGKSKLIAILLALFLGRYGVHKFYLNKPAMGVIYLLFSRFEITMFFAIIEAFVYLFMKEETWRKVYGVKINKTDKK